MRTEDEAREIDPWRTVAMKTSQAILDGAPYRLSSLGRLAKEFIVQRLIEESTVRARDEAQARVATLGGLLGDCPVMWQPAYALGDTNGKRVYTTHEAACARSFVSEAREVVVVPKARIDAALEEK